MKSSRILLLLVLTALFFSCKAPRQLPTYLQQITDTTQLPPINVPELILQKGDILTIQIMSLSTKPEQSDMIYNQPAYYEEEAAPKSKVEKVIDKLNPFNLFSKKK